MFLFFSAKECDVLHGECVQTYVPYLFLVIPLGKLIMSSEYGILKKNYDWNVDVKVNGLAYYICIQAIIYKIR